MTMTAPLRICAAIKTLMLGKPVTGIVQPRVAMETVVLWRCFWGQQFLVMLNASLLAQLGLALAMMVVVRLAALRGMIRIVRRVVAMG